MHSSESFKREEAALEKAQQLLNPREDFIENSWVHLETKLRITPQEVPRVPRRRFKTLVQVAAAFAVVLLVINGGGAVFVASAHAGPSDVLYPVKRSIETVRIARATTNEAKAQRSLEVAEARFAEGKPAEAEQAIANAIRYLQNSNTLSLMEKSLLTQKDTMQKKVFVSAMLGAMLLSSPAMAAEGLQEKPGVLPGSPLYFFDTLGENIGLFFAWGDGSKAAKLLAIAEERLAEANVSAEAKKDSAFVKAMQNYEDTMKKVEERLKKADEKNKEKVGTVVAEGTARHLSALERVLDKVPQTARPAIERALEVSNRENNEAVRVVADKDAVKAASIVMERAKMHLDAVEKALEEKSEKNLEKAEKLHEDALARAEEVSNIARGNGQDLTEVEKIVGDELTKRIEAITKALENAPESAKPALTRVLEKAKEAAAKAEKRRAEHEANQKANEERREEKKVNQEMKQEERKQQQEEKREVRRAKREDAKREAPEVKNESAEMENEENDGVR